MYKYRLETLVVASQSEKKELLSNISMYGDEEIEKCYSIIHHINLPDNDGYRGSVYWDCDLPPSIYLNEIQAKFVIRFSTNTEYLQRCYYSDSRAIVRQACKNNPYSGIRNDECNRYEGIPITAELLRILDLQRVYTHIDMYCSLTHSCWYNNLAEYMELNRGEIYTLLPALKILEITVYLFNRPGGFYARKHINPPIEPSKNGLVVCGEYDSLDIRYQGLQPFGDKVSSDLLKVLFGFSYMSLETYLSIWTELLRREGIGAILYSLDWSSVSNAVDKVVSALGEGCEEEMDLLLSLFPKVCEGLEYLHSVNLDIEGIEHQGKTSPEGSYDYLVAVNRLMEEGCESIDKESLLLMLFETCNSVVYDRMGKTKKTQLEIEYYMKKHGVAFTSYNLKMLEGLVAEVDVELETLVKLIS